MNTSLDYVLVNRVRLHSTRDVLCGEVFCAFADRHLHVEGFQLQNSSLTIVKKQVLTLQEICCPILPSNCREIDAFTEFSTLNPVESGNLEFQVKLLIDTC
jgi:hypothetical protein